MVRATASVNGQDIARTTEGHPARLFPDHASTVSLRVFNDGSHTVIIRTVELQGQVLGLDFFDFETSVGLKIRPHSSADLRYTLDLSGLKGQATGLIPASLVLLDADRNVVASIPFVSDVRGSIVSVYGLFGLALVLLTLLALLNALVALALHRLPSNRFRRGVQFLIPGIGIGLILVFTLSALRDWLPSNGHWLITVLVAGAVFFVLGYLTPTGAEDEDEDEDDDVDGDVPADESTGPLAQTTVGQRQ
jgi:hypothetical protein